jgi:hypothetical protein
MEPESSSPCSQDPETESYKLHSIMYISRTYTNPPKSDSYVKGKIKLSLCFFFLTKHHAMGAYWGGEVQLHAFLTSVLDGGE